MKRLGFVSLIGISWMLARPGALRAEAPPALPMSSTAEQAPTKTDTVARCVANHERARLLRVDYRLMEAMDAAKGCVSDECPLTIRADCSDWMTEIASLLPSVLLLVEGDESAKEKPRVYVDGTLIDPELAGAPLVLAPGVHRLRVELPPHPPIEQALVLGEGEKNRVLRVRFDTGREPAVRTPATRESRAEPRPTPSVRLSTYLLAGGALATASASAILLGSALKERSDALETCAPSCKQDVKRSIDRRLLLADITGGVAVGLASAALWTFLHPPKRDSTISVGVSSVKLGVSPNDLGVQLEGAF